MNNIDVTYTCINNKQIDVQIPGFLSHVFHEGDIITPIRTVILLPNMSLQPGLESASVPELLKEAHAIRECQLCARS